MHLQRSWLTTSVFQGMVGRVPARRCALSEGVHGQIPLECTSHYFPVWDICNHISILKSLFHSQSVDSNPFMDFIVYEYNYTVLDSFVKWVMSVLSITFPFFQSLHFMFLPGTKSSFLRGGSLVSKKYIPCSCSLCGEELSTAVPRHWII